MIKSYPCRFNNNLSRYDFDKDLDNDKIFKYRIPIHDNLSNESNIGMIKYFDEAYELILSINQIIVNIDQQQIRNKNIQKLQNQYLFFQDQKFEELLTLPDYTYLLQQINQSEQRFVEEEFMKNNNFSWLKKIIENIFEINIAKNSSTRMATYINALMNRQYDLALIEYEKLSSNQKIFFKSSYELAQAYNNQQVFLENMI